MTISAAHNYLDYSRQSNLMYDYPTISLRIKYRIINDLGIPMLFLIKDVCIIETSKALNPPAYGRKCYLVSVK